MDGLKQINDRFGHAGGSAALVQAAEIYRQAMRESGIIARIGGDEFVILAIGTTPAGDEVPARLKAKLDEYNAHSGRPYQLRVSIGIERVDPGARPRSRRCWPAPTSECTSINAGSRTRTLTSYPG